MTKQEIKRLALENGFKLKEQPSGEMDLNPYVYDFANALVKQLQPDMFWNSDGDMSFDSIEELFDYYAEGSEFEIDCQTAFSLPNRTYRGVYDESNNEWVITELRKEQE